MRGVALGRKNWIHVGSAEAGPKVAAILSVVEDLSRLAGTCKRLGRNVRAYLADMLPPLVTTSIQRVGNLLLRVGRRPGMPGRPLAEAEARRLTYCKTPSPVKNAVGLTLTDHQQDRTTESDHGKGIGLPASSVRTRLGGGGA